MRLSRIIIALVAGAAMLAAPTAAGAAQPVTPQPTAPAPTQPQPPYPPQPALLTLSRTTIVLGETVILRGRVFAPNEQVDVNVTVGPLAAGRPGVERARRSDGTTVAMAPVAFDLPTRFAPTHFVVRTDGDGSFDRRYKPTEAGEWTFTATGRTSGLTGSVVLTVLLAQQPPAQQPGLPTTGSTSAGKALVIGGSLVGVGVVLLLLTFAWRRHRRFTLGGAR